MVRLLFLAVLGLVAVHRPSLVMVRGLLTVVASLVSEQGSRVSMRASAVAACRLRGCDSQTLERRLSSCGTWV